MKIASVAIVGVSGFGGVHYRDLLREVGIGRARAAAATIINADEEPEKTKELKSIGCEIFTDYQAMLNKWAGKLDLCMIPTGIHLHKPMTIDALKAGANVFVEKPAAATVQDVDEMLEAERQSGRFVSVGFQFNFSQQLNQIKKAILGGRIGKVELIKCSGLWPRTSSYYLRNNWAGKIRNGDHWVLDSPFHNALSHWIMLMCFLAGDKQFEIAEPTAVTAELYRAKPIESCDTAAIRIETSTGIPLLMFVTHSCPRNHDPLLIVRGTKGEIRWPGYQHADIEGPDGGMIPFDGNGPLREAVFDAIFRRTSDPDAYICSLRHARAQVVVANGAYESSPIHTISGGNIRKVVSDEEDENYVIANIEPAIRDCMAREKLFSEIGVPWAKAGQRFDLNGYSVFKGGKAVTK